MVASVIERSEVNQVDLNSVLNPKHQRELIHKRGLNPDWIAANCKSINAKTASEHLGYKAWSDGILLTGDGYQEQFKPDFPWANKEGKKAKYLSCRDEDGYDVMLPRHPEDPRYWDDMAALKSKCYQIDGNPCLMLTEGHFKAISLTSNGVPTIALLGVEMGLTSGKRDPQRKRYLVNTLERFAKAGFHFIIGFDADCATKKAVLMAQLKLAHQLSLFGVPVYSITGLWHEAEGKGIDDYIQKNGFEKFRDQILSKAESIEQWKEKHLPVLERHFNQGSKNKPPTPVEIAKEIAEEYAGQLAFNDETNTWMRYEAEYKGVWSPESDRYIRSIISIVLESKGVKFRTQTYAKQVIESLEVHPDILKRKWLERSPNEVLPHHNGVLEIATGKLLEHSPENYLTWTLPRKYDPNAKDWEKINTWLDQVSQGNLVIRNLLICFANAVLKGRSDLQKMMHLMGLGGSGKTTYSNLITDLIGENNVLDEGVEQFCTNRFTPIRAYQKRLVLFSDEQGLPKNISNIMKLVGGNNLTGEQKGKPAFQFRFTGMAMLVSEHPIAQGIKGNGWKRRIIPIPMNLRVADKDRRDLRAEFQPELAAFTNYLLSLDDEFVTKTLRGVENIPECQLQFWQSRLREDSIAAWVNDCIIRNPSAKTPVGNDKNEADERTPITLFGSYADYCKRTGKTLKSSQNFSPDLIEVCQSVLGWEVERIKTKTARCISGIRLRREGFDDHIPTYEETLTESVTEQVNPSKTERVAEKAIAETPVNQGIDSMGGGGDGLTEHSLSINSDSSQKPEPDKQELSPEECQKRGFLKTPWGLLKDGQHFNLDGTPKQKPVEPKVPVKPAIANLTSSQKKKWLKQNKDIKPVIWVEHPDYTGIAELGGRSYLDEVPWKVLHNNGVLNVPADNISVLKSLCGDLTPISDPPEGDQGELPLEQLPQTESSKQRIKRLIKQISETGESKRTQKEVLAPYLEVFSKSKLGDLTEDEATRLADKLEEQVKATEKFLDDNNIIRRLEE